MFLIIIITFKKKVFMCEVLRIGYNEACPAKWNEGEATLKPSEFLVGRVGEVIGKGK